MSTGEPPPPGVERSPNFSTTHWSVVRAAGAGPEGATEARLALAQLCRSYWYPIYSYLRRTGRKPADAQDLTQEFFSRLIEKRRLEGLEARDVRFRSFLLGTLRNYLSDERKRARAQRRGGGEIPISLDDDTAESRYLVEPADATNPELLYERTWAHAVLAKVLARLRARYTEKGQGAVYAALEPLLTGGDVGGTLRQIGDAVGLSEGATKVAAHRLRREFGRVLRQEIAMTVADPSEVEGEIRHLVQILAKR